MELNPIAPGSAKVRTTCLIFCTSHKALAPIKDSVTTTRSMSAISFSSPPENKVIFFVALVTLFSSTTFWAKIPAAIPAAVPSVMKEKTLFVPVETGIRGL